ncbi:MAG TPA: type II secretion system F family protein [Thermoanaerobaculia bacterium]|nr:type II secretion system F family protein [Thermoanaerobaculia bacterium]
MEFLCRLGTPEGRVVEEIHESSDMESLRGALERRGFHVFALERRGFPIAFRLPSFRRRRVTERQFLVFNQELAALLRAGLPLLQSLDLLLERRTHPGFKSLLAEVRERVKAGEDLSDAFAHYGDLFPPLYAASLKAGERSGELEKVIRRFIRYLQLVLKAKRKAVSALVYPAVLVALSVGMIAIMSLYVIPRFEDFYDALDVELPGVTRAVLAASLFVRRHAVLLLLTLAGTAFAWQRWSGTTAGRLMIDRTKLRIPLVGPILHRFALSEFTRSLSTLLSGGIPLVPSLEVSTRAVGNRFVRSRLEPAAGQLREGSAFHETMTRSGVVTDIAIDMIKVGESTGALADMLNEVSDFLDEEVETRVERILALLEPVMLVVMGGIIAALLIAMYLPMFSAWQELR